VKTRILLPRALPDEKRQCGRWCPGWWYQEWLGRGFLFLPAQVSQNPAKQIAPYAPLEISRADLDSDPVSSILKRLKETGKLVLEGNPLANQ